MGVPHLTYIQVFVLQLHHSGGNLANQKKLQIGKKILRLAYLT